MGKPIPPNKRGGDKEQGDKMKLPDQDTSGLLVSPQARSCLLAGCSWHLRSEWLHVKEARKICLSNPHNRDNISA